MFFVSEILAIQRKLLWDVRFEKLYRDYVIVGDRNDDTVNLQDESNSNQQNVIDYIDIVLKSNLRTLLISRVAYKILDASEYTNCHKSTKAELNRLKQYVSSSDIKFYSNYVINQIVNCPKYEIIEKILKRSSLRSLLWKRETLRNNVQDKKKWLLICSTLKREWGRYSETIPTEYLINHAVNMLQEFRKSQLNKTVMLE